MEETNARDELRRRPGRTPFGVRWCEMLVAQASRELTDGQVQNITLNIARSQRESKVLRRDRFVPEKKEKMTRKYFEERENALIMNKSDGALIDTMEEVELEAGLDMSPLEQSWYQYVVAGGQKPAQSSATVAECVPF
jgi:hypothetical protein